MTTKSWFGVAAGAFIALVVPISILLLARLVEIGIADSHEMHALNSQIVVILLFELLLGPIGIRIAGRSGHIRATGTWVILSLVAGAALAYLSVTGLILFRQSTGNPPI